MVVFGSIYEEDLSLCSICKQWAKVIVQVIKEYAKEVCLFALSPTADITNRVCYCVPVVCYSSGLGQAEK